MTATIDTSWIDERVEAREFSGVALVTAGSREVFTYAGGLAHRGHGVPVTVDTRFRVASVAKMAVAITALRLVELGALELHGSVLGVLAPDQRPRSLSPAHRLHHLLSHTSGIANYHDDEDETWASFTACWDQIPPQRVRRPGDLLPLFAERPAVFAPGERFEYGDVNYLLVGMMIEAVTGRSFAEAVAEHVFVPAGMVDSDFAANDAEPARLATGYVVQDGPWETWPSNVFSVPAAGLPDGGLISTAADLARLVTALTTGALLGPDLTAAMTSPQVPSSDDLEQYGYGLELVVEGDAVTMLGHGGHDPGVSTLVSHWIAEDITIVVLCNQDRCSWPVTQYLGAALDLPEPRD